VAEVTMQPLIRFPLDAAILFSDILVVPQAMGLKVEMVKEVGPVIENPILDPSDLRKRINPDLLNVNELNYVMEGIKETLRHLKGRVPLIGFSGAPWTLMCYMIEGQGSKTWDSVKAWLYKYPEDSHFLLNTVANLVADYLINQINAGVHAIQLFETWGEVLSVEHFNEFSFKYIKQICEKVKRETKNKVPIIVFLKGIHHSYNEIAACDCINVLSVDWISDPIHLRNVFGNTKTLQGNLDPCALYAPDDQIRKYTKTMLEKFGTSRYIANLGHGLLPSHDPEKVGLFINSVHEISKEMINKKETTQ